MKKDITIEEIVEEFKQKQTELDTNGGFLADIGEDYDAVDFNTEAMENWLTQTLQTERQRCEEMVEAEKLKWVNSKRISQFIGIDWNGQEVTEKYADDLELEPEEELDDLVNEISKKMVGKFAGSYSIKVVRNYQEGQMSHPETGQWDFPPYYEIDSFYYRRDGDYQSEYKALTQPNNK